MNPSGRERFRRSSWFGVGPDLRAVRVESRALMACPEVGPYPQVVARRVEAVMHPPYHFS